MTLPSVTVTSGDGPVSRSIRSQSGTWFVAGFAERGPVDKPVEIFSKSQFLALLGTRQSYSPLYDSLDAYFRVGGIRAVVQRVVGPGADTATDNLADATPLDTATVNAISPGEWANDVEVAITAGSVGGTFVITITDDDEVVEVSPDLANNTEANAWAEASSNYIEYIDLGHGDPVVQTITLSGGDDDRAGALDAHFKAGLDLMPRDMGPGQVSYPGRTTTQAHTDLMAHAAATNRWPIHDLPDTAVVGTLTSAVAALRGLTTVRRGEAWAPWAVVPGPSAGQADRTVPWSAIQAGLIARSDASGKSPNIAVAGENGRAPYVQDLSQLPWNDTQREQLNDGGVNVAIMRNAEARSYGDRSLVSPITDPNWIQASNGRLLMVIQFRAEQIAERYLFSQIDGKGQKIADFGGELKAMLSEYYEEGSLFGATPAEAFRVDVGPAVNTSDTLANRELHAEIELKTSPTAETVNIRISKVANTEAI